MKEYLRAIVLVTVTFLFMETTIHVVIEFGVVCIDFECWPSSHIEFVRITVQNQCERHETVTRRRVHEFVVMIHTRIFLER